MTEVRENLKKYLVIKDSIQDNRVNQILEKIIIGKKLTKEDNSFLEKFDHIINLELKDYSHLSKNMCVEIMRGLIDKGIRIICDLTDRNGKLNEVIIKLENNFEENNCKIILKNGEIAYLYDNFLYNLIYNVKKNYYSLTIQDEYFEKITVDKNED
jgi:hypothetical protein